MTHEAISTRWRNNRLKLKDDVAAAYTVAELNANTDRLCTAHGRKQNFKKFVRKLCDF
jgi:hypothetical protein